MQRIIAVSCVINRVTLLSLYEWVDGAGMVLSSAGGGSGLRNGRRGGCGEG